MNLDGLLCAVCVLAFEPDAPPVTGYRPASASAPGERVYGVTLRMVLEGVVRRCQDVNVSPLPLHAVTIVQATAVCERHARALLEPVLNPLPSGQRRVGMFGGYGR